MSNEYNLGSLHTVLVYVGLVTRRYHHIPLEDPSRIISFQQRRVMTVRRQWIDWLKTKAPFWKREEFADGDARWVAAKNEDDAAAARWSVKNI